MVTKMNALRQSTANSQDPPRTVLPQRQRHRGEPEVEDEQHKPLLPTTNARQEAVAEQLLRWMAVPICHESIYITSRESEKLG